MPYHICYGTDHLDEEIANLQHEKYKVIVPAESAVAFGGRRVAFLISRSIGLIELVEE